jgi:hypothetical protein
MEKGAGSSILCHKAAELLYRSASRIKDGSAKPRRSHERVYLRRFGRRSPESVMSIKVRWRIVVENKEARRATTQGLAMETP